MPDPFEHKSDTDIHITDPDTSTYKAKVVVDPESNYALKVKGHVVLIDENNNKINSVLKGSIRAIAVDIAGSSGSAVTFSIANRLETNETTSASGWTTILNVSVPSGKTWYLKGLILSTEAFSRVRMSIGGTNKFNCRSDADDVNEVNLHGYKVDENTAILIEADAGGVGKSLIANLVIYEV